MTTTILYQNIYLQTIWDNKHTINSYEFFYFGSVKLIKYKICMLVYYFTNFCDQNDPSNLPHRICVKNFTGISFSNIILVKIQRLMLDFGGINWKVRNILQAKLIFKLLQMMVVGGCVWIIGSWTIKLLQCCWLRSRLVVWGCVWIIGSWTKWQLRIGIHSQGLMILWIS